MSTDGVAEAMRQVSLDDTGVSLDDTREPHAMDAESQQVAPKHSEKDADGPHLEGIYNAVVINRETPPVYNGNSRAELASWYVRAKDYYNRMAKCQSPVPWRLLFHPEKLLYIANWGLPEPSEVSLLTDRVLSDWIEGQLTTESGEVVNHIQAAMASLKMEFTPGIPQSGVEKFFQNFENILQKYHLSYMRNSDEGKERLVRILIRAVRPRELQEMLRAEIENDPLIGKSLIRFHQRVKACAVMVDRVLTCQRRISSYSKRERTEAGKSEQTSQKAALGKKRSRDPIDSEKGKKVVCWSCKKEGHPRRLCPDKKFNKKPKTDSDYVGVCALSLDSGRSIFVQIGSESSIPAILDSGAHHVSLIPRNRINKLIKLGMKHVVLERLDSPFKITLGDNHTIVEVREAVTLDITILCTVREVLILMYCQIDFKSALAVYCKITVFFKKCAKNT